MSHLVLGALITSKLRDDGKGERIAKIARAAEEFNNKAPPSLASATPAQRKELMAVLEDIARNITHYVAWRSPYARNGGAQNRLRIDKWEQLDALKKQVAKKAKELGFRLMAAPATMAKTQGGLNTATEPNRTSNHFNWLEWIVPVGDDNKRPRGQELSTVFEEWLAQSKQNPGADMGFWDYLKSNDSPKLKAAGEILYREDDDAWSKAKLGADGLWRDEGTLVTVVRESLIVVPYDMGDGKFWYTRGKGGKVHHSSGANGGAVRFVGDFMMAQGRFTHLTLHSGHYRPTLNSSQGWIDANMAGLSGINITSFEGDPLLTIQKSAAHLAAERNLLEGYPDQLPGS